MDKRVSPWRSWIFWGVVLQFLGLALFFAGASDEGSGALVSIGALTAWAGGLLFAIGIVSLGVFIGTRAALEEKFPTGVVAAGVVDRTPPPNPTSTFPSPPQVPPSDSGGPPIG